MKQIKQPHRRPLRLQQYDYSKAGAYFLTICVHNRRHLFGNIADGQMHLNDAGHLVEQWWNELNRKFKEIKTDAFTAMPNHIHGIVIIVGADLCVRPKIGTGGTSHKGAHTGAPLPEIVQWFKTMTTNDYIRGVNQYGWTRFDKKLWQRNYYEHVIRDEDALNRTREYITTNPMRWHLDRENPQRTGEDEFDKWLAAHKARPDKGRTKP